MLTSKPDCRLSDSFFRLRMRRGLLWRGNLPALRDYPDAGKNAALLAIIFACWILASSIDYAVEKDIEAARQSARTEVAEQVAIDCLNGQARWVYDNGTAAGYGKTLVGCAGAEEMPL
jgi:hypothetical protein